MRKAFGVVCMALGLAMLIGAGWLLMENRAEESEAGVAADQAMEELRAAMEDVLTVSAMPTLSPEATIEPAATPIPEMPTMEIDGEAYIGYLEMPTIGLSLPVMSDWSYAKLRIAPCRYWGSVYDGSLVIMAHNYDRHFGRIGTLQEGDPVQFVGADGEIYCYVVSGQETLQPTDISGMLGDDADLTLFTCTYGGRSRVTVRLKRVLAY